MRIGICARASIKTRVTLCTLAIIIVSILTLGLYGRLLIHRVVSDLLGQQQLATTSTLADAIAQEVDERRRAIVALAASLPAAGARNPSMLRRLSERHHDWPRQFDAGIYVVHADGAVTPEAPQGATLRTRDFVADALRQGTTTIGLAPEAAPLTLGVAAPLRDARGRVVAVVLGLYTAGPATHWQHFVADQRGGDNAYHLLLPRQRQLIGGGTTGVLSLPAPGALPLIEHFIAGQEGYGIIDDFQGQAVLASASRIAATDWRVLATLPVQNAVAPFRVVRENLMLATLFVCLLASTAIWLLLRRQLNPMLAAVKTLATQSAGRQRPGPLPVPEQHEIAELIVAFNGLTATLVERETALNAAQSELRIAAAAFESHQGMLVTDADGIIQRVNKAFTESTGYRADEVVGQTPRLLKSGRHDADFYRAMWEALQRTGNWQGEVWDRRKNGEIYPKWLTITRVDDPSGVATHYVGAHLDITDRKLQDERIEQLAFHDPLTRLPNRRLLGDRLEQAIAVGRRSAGHYALMFIDLDNFKPLNDRHGHVAGDALLIEAADRLRRCVREVDTVARFGGDEFVVLLSELGADRDAATAHAAAVAEKIRAALAAPYRLPITRRGQAETIVEHRCSASIGVVVAGSGEADADELLGRGDAAMYAAKTSGRDTVHLYGGATPQAAASAPDTRPVDGARR